MVQERLSKKFCIEIRYWKNCGVIIWSNSDSRRWIVRVSFNPINFVYILKICVIDFISGLMHFYCTSSHNSPSESRILKRRFAMMATAYKYLDIGINVGPYVLCGNVPIIIKAIIQSCLVQRVAKHFIERDVLILNHSCSQPRFHHYRFKIWLWNS